MAFAYLLATTGEGDTLDKLRADAGEEFFVQMDFVTQHPFDVLQNRITNDPYGRTHVRKGRVHPDSNFQNLKVTGYRIIERHPLSAKVLVIYRTPDGGDTNSGSFNGWLMSSRFSQHTEKIGRSLDEVDKSGTVIRKGRLIGSHIYRPLKAPDPVAETETHLATDPATGKEIKLIGLGWNRERMGFDEDPPMRVTGFDRTFIALDMNLSRVVTKMSFEIMRKVQSLGGKVNDREWNGFPAATLKFEDFTVEERSTGDGFEYPVTVSLSFLEEGWTPYEAVETYMTESGEEAGVRIKGIVGPGLDAIVVQESFKVYDRVSFGALFTTIESSLTPRAPRGRAGRV